MVQLRVILVFSIFSSSILAGQDGVYSCQSADNETRLLFNEDSSKVRFEHKGNFWSFSENQVSKDTRKDQHGSFWLTASATVPPIYIKVWLEELKPLERQSDGDIDYIQSFATSVFMQQAKKAKRKKGETKDLGEKILLSCNVRESNCFDNDSESESETESD